MNYSYGYEYAIAFDLEASDAPAVDGVVYGQVDKLICEFITSLTEKYHIKKIRLDKDLKEVKKDGKN